MVELHPVMNATKWRELRDAMCAVGSVTTYRIMRISGYCSSPDAEWFYHFQEGGYEDIRYVDIFATDQSHREEVGSTLKKFICRGRKPIMASGCMGMSHLDKPSTIWIEDRFGSE
jgi:hypothetical protein